MREYMVAVRDTGTRWRYQCIQILLHRRIWCNQVKVIMYGSLFFTHCVQKKIVTKKFILGDWVFVIFGISWQQCGGRETLWNSCSRNTFSCFCELIYGKYIMISFPFSLFPCWDSWLSLLFSVLTGLDLVFSGIQTKSQEMKGAIDNIHH
jgi:hypothetical protein